jgi:hypothetical protein
VARTGPLGESRPSAEDVETIRETLVVLARELDRLDSQLIGRAFHFEASYRSLPVDPSNGADAVVLSTRQRIVGWLTRTLGTYAATSHLLHQSQIEVREDRATCETYVTAHHLSAPDERGRAVDTVVGARWIDELVRSESGWVILSRVVDVDWRYDLLADQVLVRDNRAAPDPVAFLPGRR